MIQLFKKVNANADWNYRGEWVIEDSKQKEWGKTVYKMLGSK